MNNKNAQAIAKLWPDLMPVAEALEDTLGTEISANYWQPHGDRYNLHSSVPRANVAVRDYDDVRRFAENLAKYAEDSVQFVKTVGIRYSTLALNDNSANISDEGDGDRLLHIFKLGSGHKFAVGIYFFKPHKAPSDEELASWFDIKAPAIPRRIVRFIDQCRRNQGRSL